MHIIFSLLFNPTLVDYIKFNIKWREAFIYLWNYSFIGLICLNDDFHIKAFSVHNWNKRRTGYLWWLQSLLKILVSVQNQAENRVSYPSLGLLWPAELKSIPSVWKFWCIFWGWGKEGMNVSKVLFVVSYPVFFFFFLILPVL